MSPAELAIRFWNMSDTEQAAFFNALAVEGAAQALHSQMVCAAVHPSLTAAGARVMETLGRAVARRLKAAAELEELDAVLEIQRRVLADPASTHEQRAEAKGRADELLDTRRTMGVLK